MFEHNVRSMHNTYIRPDIGSISAIHVAVGTFLILWVTLFAGLVLGGTGLLPTPVLAAFEFVFIDLLYMTGWRIWIDVRPSSSPIGFYPASLIGYSILACLVAAWYHVLDYVR